jgi:hypothetical protein
MLHSILQAEYAPCDCAIRGRYGTLEDVIVVPIQRQRWRYEMAYQRDGGLAWISRIEAWKFPFPTSHHTPRDTGMAIRVEGRIIIMLGKQPHEPSKSIVPKRVTVYCMVALGPRLGPRIGERNAYLSDDPHTMLG